ncbi:MAG: IS1634 family transposase [Bacteroidales bacterium]|nr:IS1634 family transposase [Bacteroidales bacterium]
MFIRENKNRSGSVSIQIVSKAKGRYRVVKSLGSATTRQEIEKLKQAARQEIKQIEHQPSLFLSEQDEQIEQAFSQLSNSSIRTVGPELIFGKIYDYIGFATVGEEMFRHLVIARLAFPLSKLKTVEYLYRYQGASLDIDAVYRFLDKLNNKLKQQVEQIAYRHTLRVSKGNIGIVFYDMTTLYFEASDEDDLRKIGFSKDRKHSNPQIYIGLLVAAGGYLIGYDIYEGNTYEGHTLIPFIEKTAAKFNLDKPVVIADSGLLSKSNIEALEKKRYEYILGARLKNEPENIKQAITSQPYANGQVLVVDKGQNRRLIVQYSDKRAAKDRYNRERGIKRLEKKVASGKLTKANINNRGYNKYLKMEGEVKLSIDREKYEKDGSWDGLKGYLTNTQLDNQNVLDNYKELWHIEKAFRMSKTDLRIRPIFHRKQQRIEAHICIAFTAYCVYKELERALYENKSSLSLKQAAELTHNMYQMEYTLPQSENTKKILLKMDEKQQELMDLVNKIF